MVLRQALQVASRPGAARRRRDALGGERGGRCPEPLGAASQWHSPSEVDMTCPRSRISCLSRPPGGSVELFDASGAGLIVNLALSKPRRYVALQRMQPGRPFRFGPRLYSKISHRACPSLSGAYHIIIMYVQCAYLQSAQIGQEVAKKWDHIPKKSRLFACITAKYLSIAFRSSS